MRRTLIPIFFYFNDTATTEIYTLSLHDALPISRSISKLLFESEVGQTVTIILQKSRWHWSALHRSLCCLIFSKLESWTRSEEHTSELQSRLHLVCRLLLEKKKKE